MTSGQIRSEFLKFFEERGHRIVPSAPVIPNDDPTLLFTNAGMNQFKDVFLGTGKREYNRAADSQKCIRVSGKHNDLEEVGRDTYHHTFFEMLGNWSFGDYYKKEAIAWAWELLTNNWKLDKRRLYATVFETDSEAEEIWKHVTDIDPSHVLRFGKKDNFWEMGETGPCGPCSEIHIDLTPDYSGGALVNAGDARVMEIWNLVFIQYNRDGAGTLTPLPAKHVDTGMGFERVCAVLQGKNSNYDTDVFMPIIRRVEEVSGIRYTENPGTQSSLPNATSAISMRVIADHVRMLSFSIADVGIPSNEGRGYVMRRILRRAARFGRNLGMHEPFIYRVVGAVVNSMGDQYPELREQQAQIERVIKGEEESFNLTLDRGIELHTSEVQRTVGAGEKVFSGDVAFKLHDTFGFPIDLTQLMAQENGLEVGVARFEELMAEQRGRGRTARVADKAAELSVDIGRTKTDFLGYDHDECDARVAEYHADADVDHIVLDRSIFYTESGGQVADIGTIELPDEKKTLIVPKVFKTSSGAIVHVIEKCPGLQTGMKVKAKLQPPRRRSIERNHSATHLVHEALRRVLGTHVHQQGSLVDAGHLRFDFNHFEKITADQLREIEDIVNAKIADGITINALNDPKDWLTIEEAKRRYPNVKMFFGEKYGDRVRVVEIDPDFSVELCGGTHVRNTRDLGLFKIISEASIASSIRRIEAVTGSGLADYIRRRYEKIGGLDRQLEELLKEQESLEQQLSAFAPVQRSVRPAVRTLTLSSSSDREALAQVEAAEGERGEALDAAAKRLHDLKKELGKYRVKEAASGIDAIVAGGVAVNGFTVVSSRIDVGNAEELKSIGDTLRSKMSSGVGILGAIVEDKVALVCVVTDDLIKDKQLQAGKIVGELARRVGGGGGGRPHLATAGGKDVAKLDDTLRQAVDVVKGML